MLTAGVLRAHLLTARLAGPVATTREQSLHSYQLFAAGDPRLMIGLDPDTQWTGAAVLRLMAERCGVSPDPGNTSGQDMIDPDRTIAALDRFAERVKQAARRREPVLIGTGHPGGLLGFYATLAAALSAAGCPVLSPADGRRIDLPTQFGLRAHRLRYIGGVAVAQPHEAGSRSGAPGAHTHSPLPLRMALAGAAALGGTLPGLVVGDHGWVCGAGQLGFEAIGLADSDDPAVFVAEAEHKVSVAVPLDDAVQPDLYRPITGYVLKQACLSR